MKCNDVEWTDVIYVKWFCFEVKWSEVALRWSSWGKKVPWTLGWHYNEDICLYCDYLIWCVSCTVVVLTSFVMCGCVYLGVFWQLCWCFGNMYTCIYCVLYWFYCVFIVSFMYIYYYFFVFTILRTITTEWKLNCSK